MLDGTFDLRIENNPISTVFSGLTELDFSHRDRYPSQNSFSNPSDGEIAASAESLKASSFPLDISTLFENFAAWVGRLQNNQALADDLSEDVRLESSFEGDDATPNHLEDFILNYMSKPNSSLKVGYAIAGMDVGDSLTCQ